MTLEDRLDLLASSQQLLACRTIAMLADHAPTRETEYIRKKHLVVVAGWFEQKYVRVWKSSLVGGKTGTQTGPNQRPQALLDWESRGEAWSVRVAEV